MAKFIQLTRRSGQTPVYVNVELIRRVALDRENGGVVVSSVGDEEGARFEETYDSVVKMIDEALAG